MSTIEAPKGGTRGKKVRGRGPGCGRGCTAGRGTKGQNARSGGRVRPGFEGGQMPLYRQLARRGFSNYPFRKTFSVVNLGDLAVFDDGQRVTKNALVERGLVKRGDRLVKILGDGDVEKKLHVEVDRVSASARQKIVKAGGDVTEILKRPKGQ